MLSLGQDLRVSGGGEDSDSEGGGAREYEETDRAHVDELRDRKVCRVLPHEFGVVRLCRTFSIYIFTGETRFAGFLCICSGWFKRIEPPRTSSNHIITEI